MYLEPRVTAKRLIDAQPGELVRIRLGDRVVLAMAAQGRTLNLVTFEQYQDRVPVPQWFPINTDSNHLALSFGHNYFYAFDFADARIIDPGGHQLYRKNGVLIIQGVDAFLRVSASDPGRSHAHVNTSTGEFVDLHPIADQIFLGKWSIRLRSSSDDVLVSRLLEKPVFDFNAMA